MNALAILGVLVIAFYALAWVITTVATLAKGISDASTSGAHAILKPIAAWVAAWSPERAAKCLNVPPSLSGGDPFEIARREITQLQGISEQARGQARILRSTKDAHPAIHYETETWRPKELRPQSKSEWLREDLSLILGGENVSIGFAAWLFYENPQPYSGSLKTLDEWRPSSVTFWEFLKELPKPTLDLPQVADWRQRYVDNAYRKQIDEYKKSQATWSKLNNDRLQLSAKYGQLLKDLDKLREEHNQAVYEFSIRSQLAFETAKATYESANAAERRTIYEGVGPYMESSLDKEAILSYFRYVMTPKVIHPAIKSISAVEYDTDTKSLLLECELPDLRHVVFKRPKARGDGYAQIPAAEQRELKSQLHPAIVLRFAKEAMREDDKKILLRVAVNGFVHFRDPGSGQFKDAYAATVLTERKALNEMELAFVNPAEAIRSLGGMAVGEAYLTTPVTPVLRFNKQDDRFVEGRDVLASTQGMNLATIPWDIFEHLVRELFQLEYARAGAEVMITRASRDRGVDAVVFDPDPMRGGKFIVQAKRYVNTVDVSSVRDLFGTLIAEGASRGILVTTSQFGRDSEAFAKEKPITLIDGPALLGLLKKHGREYRLDLEEARRINAQEARGPY